MKKILSVILCLTISFSAFSYRQGDKVMLKVSEGCHACAEAEQTLRSHHIPFTTSTGHGFVPQLYVNGKYVGMGSDSVEKYANS